MEKVRKGVVAAGHEVTAEAAADCLRKGGNAFDAVVCGFFAACVAEPILASPGGGGFLMAHTAAGQTGYYDFFCDTPGRKRREEVEFFGIHGDFGTNTQEFHVGVGAAAVPGAIPGMFRIHKDLCQLPFEHLLEPSIDLARKGVPLNAFQAYVLDILQPIYTLNEACRSLFGNPARQNGLKGEGESIANPELEDFLDTLGKEGLPFYQKGGFADGMRKLCQDHHAHIDPEDLRTYKVVCARPKRGKCGTDQFFFPGPTSAGGRVLVKTLDQIRMDEWRKLSWGTPGYIKKLLELMAFSDEARIQMQSQPDSIPKSFRFAPVISRGTTHISVADREGNLASMTISNGEGCGYIVPGTGIILNNMLGEEDLAPQGVGNWEPGHRLLSMMCPSLAVGADGTWCAFGSGGSNRIRTALLQFVLQRSVFGGNLKQAVEAPRCHLEGDHLDYERGNWDPNMVIGGMDYKEWPTPNLFFGGVHAVERREGPGSCEFSGHADPRRGGAVVIA